MQIVLGEMAPDVSEQGSLKLTIPKKELALFDRHAGAITLLHLHGLITDSEALRSRRRLVKKIQRSVDRNLATAPRA